MLPIEIYKKCLQLSIDAREYIENLERFFAGPRLSTELNREIARQLIETLELKITYKTKNDNIKLE